MRLTNDLLDVADVFNLLEDVELLIETRLSDREPLGDRARVSGAFAARAEDDAAAEAQLLAKGQLDIVRFIVAKSTLDNVEFLEGASHKRMV